MDTDLPCHASCSRPCTSLQEMAVFAKALLCNTKDRVDISRPHLLLLAGFFSFPVQLLILKQNPALCFLSGLTVKNVKQKVCIQEFKFGFLACLTLSLAVHLEVFSPCEFQPYSSYARLVTQGITSSSSVLQAYIEKKEERINHKLHLKFTIYSIMLLGIYHCFLNTLII